jgi:uncharacterized protein
MSNFYPPGSREFQDRFDTRRLADRLEERLLRAQITAEDRAFIARLPMFFLATADEHGQPQCSYKGGAPGFVRCLDEHTLAFPSYDGNGMFLSLGNLAHNPQVGLLFIDFEAQRRIRVNGVVSLLEGDPLLVDYPEAQVIVRVHVTQVFPNCPRYIHKLEVVELSNFVPQTGCETPVPNWKRRPWSREVLPAGDPALKTEAIE